MFNFEKLRTYQEGILFIDSVYILTQSFPKEELFGLTNQLRRAAVSIVLNIAEGSSRSKKDFRHFLDIARGSCYECIAVLQIARNRSFLNENKFMDFKSKCVILSKMLSKLKSSIL